MSLKAAGTVVGREENLEAVSIFLPEYVGRLLPMNEFLSTRAESCGIHREFMSVTKVVQLVRVAYDGISIELESLSVSRKESDASVDVPFPSCFGHLHLLASQNMGFGEI